MLAPAPRKGNLVVRFRGKGAGRPILFLGHLDVVEAKRSDWSFDPFEFREQDGYVYGRGAQDMKGADAILIASLPLFAVRTMQDILVEQRWPFRVFGTLFAVFAAIALVLSSVGIYAVMAYSVSRRTQEIGVRMALGASGWSVLRLVLSLGCKQLVVGIAIGLAAAFGLTRVLSALLMRISPTDPLTFAGITLLLTAVGGLACWLPARKATQIDPIIALRYE